MMSSTPSLPINENKLPQKCAIKELDSACLNTLLAEQMNAPEIKLHVVEKGVLKFAQDNKGYARPLSYYIVEKDYLVKSIVKDEKDYLQKRLVFFDVTKDAETDENLPYLYNVCHLFKSIQPLSDSENNAENKEVVEFLNREKTKKSLFIMPIQQCRGLFRLPPEYAAKSHIILAIFDHETNALTAYDSQRGIPLLDYFINIPLPNFVYPDKFTEKKGYAYKGTLPLAIQKEPHLCGYIINTLRASFLEKGNTDLFQKILINAELIISKEYYLENHLAITKRIIKTIFSEKDLDSWVELSFHKDETKETALSIPDTNRKSALSSSSQSTTFFSAKRVDRPTQVTLNVTEEGAVTLQLHF